jgi:hypothetical protein
MTMVKSRSVGHGVHNAPTKTDNTADLRHDGQLGEDQALPAGPESPPGSALASESVPVAAERPR